MKVSTHELGWDAAGRAILDDASVAFESGRLTAVIGRNGSGKTTLLRLLGGLLRPARGRVEYDGNDLSGIRPRARARQVAMLEQHPNTNLELRVRDVVALGRIPHLGRWPTSRDPAGDAVELAMEAAEVTSLADRLWSTLSGGERQRAQLARALAQQPRVLLLDEPTNHLDLHHQIALLAQVAALGLTSVVVLHDLDLAAAFCPQIVVLDQGRVVAAGPTDEVLDAALVARVFNVRAEVTRDDRLRVAWHSSL